MSALRRIILCGGIAVMLTGLSGCMQAKQTRYRQHLGFAVKPIKATGGDRGLAQGNLDFSRRNRRR